MHHHQHTHHHLPPPQSTILFPPESHSSTADAPPKQVSLAMDRLAHAARLIADIRLGADRLLEALFLAGEQANQSGGVNKPLHLIVQEGASMRQYLQDLRTVGRQLEDSGVLNESLKSRSNSWGLHMPLVCPDGAVVAYAWKRQLAGQAGASAVDRTRLALKAFTDQKRRFFPHLDEEAVDGPVSKKHRGAQNSTANQQEEFGDMRTVLDVLTELEKEVPEVKTSTYQRLDWLKRASLLPCETLDEPPKDHSFHSSRDMRSGLGGTVAADQIAVIELLIPSVFRAVISLHPTGSLNPDAVSFFSPDEGGSHVHARGVSAFNAFRNITEHAAMAPQYFIGVNADTALYSLLHWICSYQNLFTKACRKCEKLLSMDKEAALLLPPVQRPYRNFSLGKHVSHNSSSKDQCTSDIPAYHIGCFPQES